MNKEEIQINNFFYVFLKEKNERIIVMVNEIDYKEEMVYVKDMNNISMLIPFSDLTPIVINEKLMNFLGFYEHKSITLARIDNNKNEKLSVFQKDKYILAYVVLYDDEKNIDTNKPNNFIWNTYFHQLQNYIRKIYDLEITDAFVGKEL